MLENLLWLCRREASAIELVISEARLSILLDHAIEGLRDCIQQKKVVIQTPQHKLPTILVDSRWAEHLLISLLRHVVERSCLSARVRLEFSSANQLGILIIESTLENSSQSAEDIGKTSALKKADKDTQPATDPLTLARYCAECLHLRLQRRGTRRESTANSSIQHKNPVISVASLRLTLSR